MLARTVSMVLLVVLLAGCGKNPATLPPAANVVQHAANAVAPGVSTPPTAGPQRLAAEHLPNAYRLHEHVISGGLPEGDAAFQELQTLGVKTIISVDGSRPDVQLAAKHGMRYVHLPHGYDGIPDARAQELAKAVRDLPGPIYIHCHHGKHRSPTAATVACVLLGLLQPGEAAKVLDTAGTSKNYRGLYQSAESARRMDDTMLDALHVEFRDSVELPPLAEAMVGIERTHDHLQQLSRHSWKPTSAHPDLDAAHEALLLREHITELLRTDEVSHKTERFVALLRESEALANALELALGEQPDDESSRSTRASDAFASISKRCTACHQEFRDVPLREKPRQ